MIDDMRLKYPIPFLCRIFDVSSSGYYARLGRPLSKRAREEQRLEVDIRAAHKRTRETHGPERLQKELEAHGVNAGVLSSFNKIPQVVSKEFPNQFQNNSPVSFRTIPHF